MYEAEDLRLLLTQEPGWMCRVSLRDCVEECPRSCAAMLMAMFDVVIVVYRHRSTQLSNAVAVSRTSFASASIHCGGCEVQTSRSSTTVHNRSPQSDIYYYRHGCTLVESARWGCAHGSGEHILTEAPWSGHTDKITADNVATSAQTTFP